METSTGGLQHQNGLVTPAFGFEQIFVLIFSLVLRNWGFDSPFISSACKGETTECSFHLVPHLFCLVVLIWWYKDGNMCLLVYVVSDLDTGHFSKFNELRDTNNL
jgi:hypothetical protein